MNTECISHNMEEADCAAIRSTAYRLFAAMFEYPDDGRLALLREGFPVTELQHVITAVTPDLAAETDWDALDRIGGGEELQVEYTRLFDAGPSGPPCSLHEGAHQPSRMGTLEDLVRFYNFFGVSRAEEPNDLPDHLSTELEFLHYLSHNEAVLCREDHNPADYRRAQRDFLLHHPGQWIARLKNKLVDNGAEDFFLELARLLDGFLNRDVQYLIGLAGRGSQDIPIPLTTIEEQPTKWAREKELEDSA
jgi:DMSO reductase family type II enzyme chaperone